MGADVDNMLVCSLSEFAKQHRYLLRENPKFTVGDLDKMTDHELLRIPGFGKRAVQDIRAVILKLKGPVDLTPKWEYTMIDMSLATGIHRLAAYGEQGWEAVCSIGQEVLMKREKRGEL